MEERQRRVTDDDHPCRGTSAPPAGLAGAPRAAIVRAGGPDRQAGARPGVAASAKPLLAGPDRCGGLRGARLPHERSRDAPRRRAALPDLARLWSQRGIPRTACPRDARSAAAQPEPRLRHRHAGGVDARRRAGGRGGAAARRAPRRPRPASCRTPARRPRGGSRGVGSRVDPRGPGLHGGGGAGGGRASAPARRHRGGRPVRLRCVALPAPPRPARPTAPVRRSWSPSSSSPRRW